MTHVVQPVGDLRNLQRRIILLALLQSFLQVLSRLPYPTRHLDEGQHLLLQVTVAQQAVHGFHEHVDTLIAELVTS